MWEDRGRMSAVATSCPSCRNHLPPGARFCAACGTRVAQSEPVSWTVSERRTFGVLPGRAQVRAARARSSRLLAVVRARVRLAYEVVAARLGAELERLRIRRHAAGIARHRGACLRALGEAVYAGDAGREERAKDALARLDSAVAAAATELGRIDERMRERIARARRESGSTEAVEPVPYPVPEPSPVPSDPPGPVIVPEPEPVPHEPPGPVIVPEPEPPTDE